LQETTLANQLKTIEKQLLKNPEMDDFKKPLENLKQQLADFEQKIKLLYQNS
jgi:polyhydroxyalkanoate synthesis regulator phasin